MPSITKDRISSPLEAGPSLLDAKRLPPQLTNALEYVSSRLARKRLHLTLIVVRKDVNIPSTPSPQSASLFSTVKSLKHQSTSTVFSDSASATSSSSNSSLSRTRHPGLPSSPRDGSAVPSVVSSPSSACFSPKLSQCPTPTSPNPYGISLMHAGTMTEKAEKILRATISKAEKKFPIGSGWLSTQPLTRTILCPATNDLIRRSLAQNNTLFSSEGLTLLGLDLVYTFKCHLHTYSRTLSPVDLTLAVDELRRLVLAQQGRRITKGYLIRAYDWLGVSLPALVDVNEGYKTAYGGALRVGGIEVQDEERRSPPPLKTNFAPMEIRRMNLSIGFVNDSETESSGSEDEVEVGESAKGCDWDVREDRGPHMRGAKTPNGFEDITPVTNGEWCFLMVGEGWQGGRAAAVETC